MGRAGRENCFTSLTCCTCTAFDLFDDKLLKVIWAFEQQRADTTSLLIDQLRYFIPSLTLSSLTLLLCSCC
jgi:hypothetical protein